jgi:ribonuclease III
MSRQADQTQALEADLGHHFSNPRLLERALTHSSYAHEAQTGSSLNAEPPADNELLEFLGDTVLSLITSQTLFERFPERSEGELSKLRAHLVSAKHLARVASVLALGEHLHLGRGEEKSGGRNKAALLANALEAVLAAIYLDAGLEAAQKFVLFKVLEPELSDLAQPGASEFKLTDYKSALQESLQSRGQSQPRYRVASETGPDHKKTFTVEVELHTSSGRQSSYVTRAAGPSKKAAEQRAAKQALEHLQRESGPHDG